MKCASAGAIPRLTKRANGARRIITLTEQGDALRYQAIDIPREMDGCIPLSDEELTELKFLLDKALVGMDQKA